MFFFFYSIRRYFVREFRHKIFIEKDTLRNKYYLFLIMIKYKKILNFFHLVENILAFTPYFIFIEHNLFIYDFMKDSE